MQASDPSRSAAALPRWGSRHTVFVVIALVNLTVWLDSGIFGALTPYWAKSLQLTPAQSGTGSAAYLLGYFPLLLVAGILADRFGARRMLLICLVGVSVMSLAMLLVNTYGLLFARNVLFGVFFGFLWAPCNRLMALWLPPRERARYAAIWMSSTLCSFVIAVPLGLLIASHSTWQLAFLVVTFLGIPGWLLLFFLTTERPEQHRGVSAAELDHIYGGRSVEAEIAASKIRWKDMRAALSQLSVLWMVIATGLTTTPTWLIGTWGTYGLITGFRLPAGTTSYLIDGMMLVPIVYGFFNGWVVEHVFGGRLRPAMALGPVISGLGYLAVALFHPDFVVWAFLIYAVAYISDPFFWGTVNAYWAGLARPEYSGTLNGISAALQVAVGYALVSLSGTWVAAGVQGPQALDRIWLIGGVIFLLSAIPVYLAREVRIAGVKRAAVSPAVG